MSLLYVFGVTFLLVEMRDGSAVSVTTLSLPECLATHSSSGERDHVDYIRDWIVLLAQHLDDEMVSWG